MTAALPRAAAPFVDFARLLHGHGFRIAPEQVTGFMAAVTLLGPRSMADIHEAALAMLAPPPERRGEFEALYRAFFHGEVRSGVVGGDDEEALIHNESSEREPQALQDAEGGASAAAAEQLAVRSFPASEKTDSLERLHRELAAALPQRRSLRSERTRTIGNVDLRRSLATIVRADGDVPQPLHHRRKSVPRRLLLLIDISGSMKQHTADHLKLAHAAVLSGGPVEVFTFGTRLTRITPALQHRDRGQALARVADLVADWDGGTRIGPTLLAFLGLPRFATLARGAAIVLLTDGLERGDHEPMVTALARLARLGWRLSLATPLAGDPRFRPESAALKAVLPCLDDLVDGSGIEPLTRFILALGRTAPSAERIWRKAS